MNIPCPAEALPPPPLSAQETPSAVPPPPPPVVIDIAADDEAADAERQEALCRAHEFSWKGQRLHPLTIDRLARYGSLRARDGGTPQHHIETERLLEDARIMIWLCAHEESAWEQGTPPLLSDRELWLRRIREWFNAHADATDAPAAIDLFLDIYETSRRTRPDVVARSDGEPSGNAPGRPR